jgi:SapC protein
MSSPQPPAPVLPLFYERPEPLRADQHHAYRLVIKPDFSFAAGTNAVPIMSSEFVAAARHYPIVFAGTPVMPAAVLGFEKFNLFVDDAGLWQDTRTYIPAYVRRYPFTFITPPDQNTFILGLDMACDRVVSDPADDKPAQPLFADGKPSALTADALRFCGALQMDHAATLTFTAALEEQNLLVDNQARAQLPSGRNYDLRGFRVVDAKRFQALPDAIVTDWHRKGWLGLVYAHLASQAGWQDLLDRMRTKDEGATSAS